MNLRSFQPHVSERQDHLTELNSCLETREGSGSFSGQSKGEDNTSQGKHSGIEEESPPLVSDPHSLHLEASLRVHWLRRVGLPGWSQLL